jgi:hypothetical protein
MQAVSAHLNVNTVQCSLPVLNECHCVQFFIAFAAKLVTRHACRAVQFSAAAVADTM